MSFWLFILIIIAVIWGPLFWVVKTWYSKGKKQAALKLFVLGAGILLSWLILEGAMYLSASAQRTVNPSNIWAGKYQDHAHPNLPYMRKANISWEGLAHGDLAILNGDRDPYASPVLYQTDKNGFRNHRDISQADIVAIGDSYTEAGILNEEDSYIYQLGELTGLRTKNLGVSGYCTPYESIIMGEYGLGLKPNVVILQVSESNDLYENLEYYEWVNAGKPPRNIDPAKLKTIDLWKLRSPTYRLYQMAFPLELNDFKLQGTFTDVASRSYLMRFANAPGKAMMPKGNVGWEIMIGSIARISEVCKENKINLVVLHIPDKINVYRDLVSLEPQAKEILADYPPIPKEEQLSFYLQGLCEELQVYYMDAGPALRLKAKAKQLAYLPMDTHLSALGHEVIAKELRKLFSQN